MKILVIDNYDSFTYNLVYYLRHEQQEVTVRRNDRIDPRDCLAFDRLLLSPGPGIPEEAGSLMEIIAMCAGKLPVLGICLGHQAIAEFLGCRLQNMEKVYHGVQSTIRQALPGTPLFRKLPETFQAGRYHSWEVNGATLNGRVEVTATDTQGAIMGLQNASEKLYGLQFHPESILTPEGPQIIRNFLMID